MPEFSLHSKTQLGSCDPRLQDVFNEVIKHVDCRVIEGHRSNDRQARLLAEGVTTLGPGESKHNTNPSLAVDVVPYPVDWDDIRRFDRFSGFVFGIAMAKGVKLRWGGDWDRDWELADNRFNDLPHFEIHEGGY